MDFKRVVMKHEGFPKDQQFIKMSNFKQQTHYMCIIWAVIFKRHNFMGFVVPLKFPSSVTRVTRVRREQVNIKSISQKLFQVVIHKI